MDEHHRLNEMRELFLNAPESTATRLLAIVASLALMSAVLILVRRRTLREEYTPIWMGVAGAILVISVQFDILRGLTRWIGAWVPSSTIFFLGQAFLVAICLNYAVRLSRAGVQIKNLAQEVALLRTRMTEWEKSPPIHSVPGGHEEDSAKR